MSKNHSIVPAIILSLAASSALAAPPPDVTAIMGASPTLKAAPGAAAAASTKAAQDGITAQTTAEERFGGTSANMHTEDQCAIVNLSISRYTPPAGQTTTYLSYDVRNLCFLDQNAGGSTELPDEMFSGDPRKSNKVTVKVDLSSLAGQVFGQPLIADITFTKTNAVINRSSYRTVSETNSAGVKKVLTFSTVTVNTTANVTGSLSLAGSSSPLPLGNGSANIAWDDTQNLTSVQ